MDRRIARRIPPSDSCALASRIGFDVGRLSCDSVIERSARARAEIPCIREMVRLSFRAFRLAND